MAMSHEETRGKPLKQSVLNFKLLVASFAGNKAEVIRLVDEDGADLYCKDSDGNTCLHYATNAEQDSPEVVTELLDRGVNRSAENNNYETALDIAFQSENYDSMQQIIKKLYKEADQLCEDNTKLMQNIGGLHDHMGEEQEFDLIDATFHGRYDYIITESEIDMLLKFLWAPCLSTKVDNRLFVTFYMSLDKEKFIRLSITDSQATLLTSWTTAHKNIDQVEEGRDNFIEFLSDDKDDPVTSAIAKAIIVSDWISKPPKQNNKNNKEFCNKQNNKNLNKDQLRDLVSSFKCSHIDWRILFANILNEVKRTTQKAKKCTDFLRTPHKGISFETANAILYFIETFALQDTHGDMPKDEKERLAQRKKAYFSRVYETFFPEGKVVDVLSTFRTLRKNILKTSGLFQVSLDTFGSFIKDKLKVESEQFLNAMSDFAETAAWRLQGEAHKVLQEESVNMFKVLKQNELQFGSAERNTTPMEISDSIRKFCENVDKLSEEPSFLQEVVFNLLVNVFPDQTKEKSPLHSRLWECRNRIIHDFQNLTATQVSQNIPSALIHTYRYEVALNMYEAFMCFRNEKDLIGLRTDLSSVIEKIGNHYTNLRLYTSNVTGHLISDAYDSAWIEKEISNIVSTYVNCMAPILDCSDHEDKDILHSQPGLSNLQKREIFEKWWALQKLSRDTEESRRIKKSLCSDYKQKLGLSEPAAQSAVKFSIINSANSALEEEIKNEVNGLVHLSISKKYNISTRNVIVLFEYVMNDKDSFNRHIGQTDISPNGRIILEERLKLAANNKQAKKVEWGHGGKLVEVNKSTIVLNILKILNEVERAYQLKYETVSSALEDPAFVLHLVDREVREVKQQDGDTTHCVLQNPFQINRLARELPSIDFIAPFLAAVLAKTGDLHVFEHNSLNVLLKTILQGSADISYVGSLISLHNDRVTQIMFDIIVKEDVDKEKAQFVLTEIARDGDLERCIKRLEITRKLEVSNIELRIASLANDAVLEKINAQKLDHAETLINEVAWSLAHLRLARTSLLKTESLGRTIRRNSCPINPSHVGDEVLNISHSRNAVPRCGELLREGTLPDETSTKRILFGDDIFIGITLLRAKLFNARGLQLCKCKPHVERQACHGREKFQQARSILKNIQDLFDGRENTRKNYMLALSRSAHTAINLNKCEGGVEFLREALTYEEEIWSVLWRTIAMSDEPPPKDCLTFLNRADGSKKYKALMADTEFWKYLNVRKVWKNVSHHKGLLGFLLKDPEYIERALEMLRESLALCAKLTDPYTDFLPSYLQKHLSVNYRNLAKIFYFQGHMISSYFYQAKRLELILMHYKSGLGWYNADSHHTQYCCSNAKDAIKNLNKMQRAMAVEESLLQLRNWE